MRIDLIYPKLPPALDGIGDHTVHLAKGLSSRNCRVRVLTAQQEWSPLPDVDVEHAFRTDPRRGTLGLSNRIQNTPPDWLLLQFEQFSYGEWGLNPFLPVAIYKLQRSSPETQIAIMFHEDYMPATNLRAAIMSLWQWPQFRVLGRMADVALFSTETRAQKYEKSLSGTPVYHLPVGSNIPNTKANRTQERKRLGIDPDSFVLGLFGSAHPSRLLSYADAAISACDRILPDCQVLYIGPDGAQVRDALTIDARLNDTGPLPPEQVSRHFAAMDLYLAPFDRGVSTRRGSFLVGLQHGVPTLSTYGRATGATLARADGTACLLTPSGQQSAFVEGATQLVQDEQRRDQLSRGGPDFYERHFSWSYLSERCLDILDRERRA